MLIRTIMFENRLHFSIHPSIFKIKTYDDSNSGIDEVIRACYRY